MAAKVYDILKGSFLTNEDSFKNWRFILFIALLAIVMIYTGHSYEKKVHQLAALNEQVTELHSEYTDLERRLMFLQMESTIARKIEDKGIAPAKNPPQKIVIVNNSNGND
jgi:type II secretory pathway component PulL